ncbi:MAG: HAD-IC family P-type ATPase [Parcubacteria group bacterium]|nr:HAD-IC family P-type ATPase [Parcubacteria group bacterium]
MTNYYTKKIENILSDLNVDEKRGLSEKEILEKIKEFGKNKLPEHKPPSTLLIFLSQFKGIFTIILLVAALISFLLHEYTDTGVIFASVILNVAIGFFQESKAQKTIDALRHMVQIEAKVLRSGKTKKIDAHELVPGDIIFLDSGDKVPSDARLISSQDFQVNESALTGESVPSKKEAEKELTEKTSLGDRVNMVYMGTVVIAGKAQAVIVATGIKTEIGKITKLVVEAKEEETPLQVRMKKLSMQITFLISIGLVIIMAFGILTGRPLADMFIFVIAMAVAAIPEGLIVAVTIILALSMRKILKRKALVRELLATETLGSTTVICTDKTGTITSGEMVVDKIITSLKDFDKDDLGKVKSCDLDNTLKNGMLCNDVYFEEVNGNDVKDWKVFGDPTEVALVMAAGKAGFKKSELQKGKKLMAEIPFDSYLKYMAVAYKDEVTGKITIYIKGSAERLMERSQYLCEEGVTRELNDSDRSKVIKSNENLSNKAYRVLACAYKEIEDNGSEINLLEEVKTGLVFTGLVGMRDPIRPGVKEAIQLCQRAGIKIKMITGDHRLTAKAIATEVGITATDSEIISGEEFDKMTPHQLENIIPKAKIFARVAPKHKLNIVDTLQRQKEVVAMTGDGINDAPALKSADIGIAMGSGTEAAKDTADMILLDSNFKTIEGAVEEGRALFDNIKKVTLYLLSDSFTELLLVGGSLLLGLPLPLTAAQILWVNLVEDGLPDFALTFEKKDKGIMKDPPRKLKEPILDREMKILIFGVGIVTDLVLFALFYYLLKTTDNMTYARTMVFAALGIDSLFYVFSCRSLRRNLWQMNPFSNKPLNFAVLFGLSMLAVSLYVPFFQNILKTVPLGLNDWIILACIGVFEIIAVEAVKWWFIVRKK